MKDYYDSLSDSDKKGVKLFGVGASLLIALIAAYAVIAASPERKYDPDTLCNAELPRAVHEMFIVDISDSLSTHQRNFVSTYIGEKLASASVNDRFSIYVLDETSRGLSEPLIDLCKPKSASDVNALTSNKQFVERTYQEKFYKPLQASIERVVEANELSISPIYEALSDVVALKKYDGQASKVEVTLLSDMLQHSESGSVYRSGANAVDGLPTINLRDLELTVFWLDRPEGSKYQTAALAKSWATYLDKVANFQKIERVRN